MRNVCKIFTESALEVTHFGVKSQRSPQEQNMRFGQPFAMVWLPHPYNSGAKEDVTNTIYEVH